MQPLVQSLTAVKGEIAPAPALPRWLAYGDWTTQGWIASGPAQGWAAIAARKTGLNLVNLGYAGAGRGEIACAEQIAALTAEIISISYGESCWSRIPHSIGMVTEGFHGFLDVVRQGHPHTPVVIVSPVLRPDAEDVPNKLGASLSEIRHAFESVTRDRIIGGDTTLSLVTGADIIEADHLADGIHPGDEGHKRIAATVGKALNAAVKSAGDGAEGSRPRSSGSAPPRCSRSRATTTPTTPIRARTRLPPPRCTDLLFRSTGGTSRRVASPLDHENRSETHHGFHHPHRFVPRRRQGGGGHRGGERHRQVECAGPGRRRRHRGVRRHPRRHRRGHRRGRSPPTGAPPRGWPSTSPAGPTSRPWPSG